MSRASYLTLPLQIRFLTAVHRRSGWRDTVAAVRAPFVASTAMGALVWGGLAMTQRIGWSCGRRRDTRSAVSSISARLRSCHPSIASLP